MSYESKEEIIKFCKPEAKVIILCLLWSSWIQIYRNEWRNCYAWLELYKAEKKQLPFMFFFNIPLPYILECIYSLLHFYRWPFNTHYYGLILLVLVTQHEFELNTNKEHGPIYKWNKLVIWSIMQFKWNFLSIKCRRRQKIVIIF